METLEEKQALTDLKRNERRTFHFLLLLFGAAFIRHLFDAYCVDSEHHSGIVFSRLYPFLFFMCSA
jgi:hypothetical protein